MLFGLKRYLVPNPIIPILIVFLATLVIYCVLGNAFKRKPLFSLRPTLTFNYRPTDWGASEYLAALTAFNILLLVYVACFIKLGFDLPKYYRWLLLAWTCLCTLALISMYYNVTTKYARFSSVLNISAGLATACFAIFTAPLVDSSITDLTGVNADKFPAAQKTLNLVAVIYCWSLIGMIVTMFVFLFIGFHTLFKTTSNTRASTLSVVALVGIAYTLVIYLNAFSELSRDLSNKRIKVLLVYSSFHVSPDKCGLVNQPANSKVALLDDDKAVIALPDPAQTYTFKRVTCSVPGSDREG